MASHTQAERYVDDVQILQRLGDAAAQHGITRESIRELLVDVSAPEPLQHGPYSKFIVFPDRSIAAQVRGSKRWEVDR